MVTALKARHWDSASLQPRRTSRTGMTSDGNDAQYYYSPATHYTKETGHKLNER